MNHTQQDQKEEILSKQYDCELCQDRGFTLTKQKQENGDYLDFAIDCECKERKSIMARLKNAMIPEEFVNARFDNYERNTPMQNLLYDATTGYLKEFANIRKTKHNSLGFLAAYGETRLKALPPGQRNETRIKHNSYGIGKTHLQMSAAKWLIHNIKIPTDVKGRERGCRVLCVSDVIFLEDLTAAKMASDGGESFNKLMGAAIDWADVLIWDDLGKAKHTETREGYYYRIINERYKAQKPIIFSSNEDVDTLEDKIGFAASDRLFGMTKNYMYEVEGDSYRTN